MSNEKIEEKQIGKSEEKPILAFSLVLAGFVTQVLIFFFRIVTLPLVEYIRRRIGSFFGLPMHPIVWIIIGVILLGLELVGVILIYSSDVSKVRVGSSLVLIASLLSYPTIWGFFIGSVLSITGSILGLTWKS